MLKITPKQLVRDLFDACQFNGANHDEIRAFVGVANYRAVRDGGSIQVLANAKFEDGDRWQVVPRGDWVRVVEPGVYEIIPAADLGKLWEIDYSGISRPARCFVEAGKPWKLWGIVTGGGVIQATRIRQQREEVEKDLAVLYGGDPSVKVEELLVCRASDVRWE